MSCNVYINKMSVIDMSVLQSHVRNTALVCCSAYIIISASSRLLQATTLSLRAATTEKTGYRTCILQCTRILETSALASGTLHLEEKSKQFRSSLHTATKMSRNMYGKSQVNVQAFIQCRF